MIDERLLAEVRPVLVGICYRMLACPYAAQDVTQQALARAWESRHRYDPARGSVRTWLAAIATNACIDELRRRPRRALPVDVADASMPGAPLGEPIEETWVLPIPSRMLAPEDAVERRESIRLAFVVALQCLTPFERAGLVLRDVLGSSAADVAHGLDRSVAAVNSALQRARRKLDSAPMPPDPVGRERSSLLERYVRAFEAYDVATLTALLHEDATMSMPPFTWWIRGRDHIASALTDSSGFCRDSRLLPVDFSGTTALAQYLPVGQDRTHEPWALVHLDTDVGQITATVSWLQPRGLFEPAGLPMTVTP